MKIKKHPLIFFYILSLILSAILLIGHILSEEIGNYSISLTQYSPFLALLITAYYFKTQAVLKNIKRQIKLNFIMLLPTLFLLATILVTIVVPTMILNYLGFAFVEWPALSGVIGLHIAAIMFGSILEDLGFRGYLFPQMLKRYNWLISSVVVGALWGLWHMYLVDGILGFLLHISFFTMMSILISYAYIKSGFNLVVVFIWHIVFNLLYRVLLWDRLTIELLIIQNIMVLICLLSLFLYMYILNSKHQIDTHIGLYS